MVHKLPWATDIFWQFNEDVLVFNVYTTVTLVLAFGNRFYRFLTLQSSGDKNPTKSAKLTASMLAK